ncbi:unnamed protein product [Dimorphilus gyrociliatus]|uniref:Fucolectin tachylectin-4 pentraxin-1 domain-containing protein n=1 Tax=Dimorphilus gyrociliatus TaxID=2664684 RepID=A0A7I8WFE0_9ANNE|nr:unnamed protein product [Dimorphilus gyrociliatus]
MLKDIIWIFFYFPIGLHSTQFMHVNLAYKQSTNISSLYETSLVHLAVNGEFNPVYQNFGRCSHSLIENKPWYLILLDKSYIIKTIRILNRATHPEALQNIIIGTQLTKDISVTDFSKYQQFSTISGGVLHSRTVTMHYTEKPHYASSIIIYRNEYGKLTLCQVEMWNLNNIAKDKIASVSSQYNSHAKASNAVDDEVCSLFEQNGLYCIHSEDEIEPWWKVDLEKMSVVYAVTIIGRGEIISDRLKNLRVAVSTNDETPTPQTSLKCGLYDGPLPLYTTIRCPKSTVGRYLSTTKIFNTNSQALIICEVDVFGFYLDGNFTINTIFYNETNYLYKTNVLTQDCNKHKKATTDISNFQISSFQLTIQGVNIENACKMGVFDLISSFKVDFREFINDCKLLHAVDGYFTERDMLDTCTYQCNCDINNCQSFSIVYSSNMDMLHKEIFIFFKY